MIYAIPIFIVALFSLTMLFEKCTSNIKITKYTFKYEYFFIAIFFILLGALSYETGRDWNNYVYFFKNLNNPSISNNLEKGYKTLNIFFKYFVDNYYIMHCCVMIITSSIIFFHFYKESKYPFLTLFCYLVPYFFSSDMAQFRQHIALSIIVCGFSSIKNKNLLEWIFIVFLASQFHISAIVAFPLYFTTRIIIKPKICWIIFLVCFFITLFGNELTRLVLNIVLKIPFVPYRIVVIGLTYLSNKAEYMKFSSGLGFISKYIFVFFIVWSYKHLIKKDNYYMLNFLIALLLQALGRNLAEFSRLGDYYLVCGSGFFAYNILIDSKYFFKKLRIVQVIMLLFFILINSFGFYKQFVTGDSPLKTDYLPYRSIIFK